MSTVPKRRFAQVERYSRQPDDQWLLTEARELTEAMVLDSISASLPLSEIYRRVDFPAPESSRDAGWPR